MKYMTLVVICILCGICVVSCREKKVRRPVAADYAHPCNPYDVYVGGREGYLHVIPKKNSDGSCDLPETRHSIPLVGED